MGKIISFKHCLKGRILKPRVHRDGHHKIQLYKNGILKEPYIHNLVLEAFVGPRPEGMNGLHFDDDQSNNCVHNLRWDTQKENFNDRAVNGKRTGKYKVKYLTPDDVEAIREALDNGATQTALAAQYGVSSTAISCIKLNKTHNHKQ